MIDGLALCSLKRRVNIIVQVMFAEMFLSLQPFTASKVRRAMLLVDEHGATLLCPLGFTVPLWKHFN